MRSYLRWIPLATLFLLGLLVAATPLTEGVSFISTTSIDVSGLVGDLINKSGVGEQTEEQFYTATTMVTKTPTTRTIIDTEAETITSVNDEQKTYVVIPFDQIGSMFSADGQPTQEAPEEDPDYTVDVSFTVEDLGPVDDPPNTEHHRIHVIADPVPTSPEVDDPGQYVLALDLYVKDIEGYDTIKRFRQAYADKMGRAMGSSQGNLLESLNRIVGDSPGLKESLERSSEAVGNMDKMAVLEVMHVFTVPPGMEYDSEKAFAPKEKKRKKGRLGRFAKRVASQATGSGTDNTSQEQKKVLTSTTNKENFSNGPINAALFEIGSDYTQQESPMRTQY